MLLLKGDVEFQFSLQIGEKLFPGFYRTVRGFKQLAEQFGRLDWGGLHQCLQVHCKFLFLPSCDRRCQPDMETGKPVL
jgi:hypothetical protein